MNEPIILGQPKAPPPKRWPVLKREGWQDFDMGAADKQIRSILTRMDKDPRPLTTMECAIITGELGVILGALMAYAEAQHHDLVAIAQAKDEPKN